MKIFGKEIPVNVRNEIEKYTFIKPRWTSDKLIACSPFRRDGTPSFYVTLEGEYAGCWKDSGAIETEWTSGNFVKLLAFLRNESTSETIEYLLLTYSDEYRGCNLDDITLDTSGFRMIERSRQTLNTEILQQYRYRHPYLGGRGVSELVQRLMQIGYCKRSKAVTIPWFTCDGRLANVKYRRISDKWFWYEKNAVPIRKLIYGMDVIYKYRKDYAVLVEGEIDALYLMTAGVPAIAIGGSAFGQDKADMIARSPLDSVYLCTDNDVVGRRIRAEAIEKLAGKVALYDVELPDIYKDANDVPNTEELRTYVEQAKRVEIGLKLALDT